MFFRIGTLSCNHNGVKSNQVDADLPKCQLGGRPRSLLHFLDEAEQLVHISYALCHYQPSQTANGAWHGLECSTTAYEYTKPRKTATCNTTDLLGRGQSSEWIAVLRSFFWGAFPGENGDKTGYKISKSTSNNILDLPARSFSTTSSARHTVSGYVVQCLVGDQGDPVGTEVHSEHAFAASESRGWTFEHCH